MKSMTELRVSLIIRTASLSLAELTAVLGVSPSRGHSLGDVPHGGRRKHFQTPLPHTSWILHSDEDATAPLDAHLRMLATAFPPQRMQQLRDALPPDIRVEVSIGAFYDGQAAHVEAGPASLAIVSAYGASLIVNAYSAGDEKQSDPEPGRQTP
jgi:Domain of unknown function (DUF4279)